MGSPIQGRIHFVIIEGNECYTTDMDFLRQLDIPHDREFKDVFPIWPGVEFTLPGKYLGRVRVKEITCHIHREDIDLPNSAGINISGVGQEFQYNFDVNVIVERV